MQKKIYETGILDEIFNLPIQYLMDSRLREVSIPTFCSLIYENKVNQNYLLKDNSPQQIVKYLKKEIQGANNLGRKNSIFSLTSYAVMSSEYNVATYEAQRLSLEMRFPQRYWDALCS